MRTAHLFAGAGGGILADIILGHEPVVAVEHDPYCCAVLRERFPGLRVVEADVSTVDFARDLAGVDVLCAGFPCQDISAAGKGAGLDGERSGLFWQVVRAIDAVRPRWVFLENSPLIRTRGRDRVLAALLERGYLVRDGLLSAAAVGAPHRRDRWWCLARLADPEGKRERPGEMRGCDGGWRVELDGPGARCNSDLGGQAKADPYADSRGRLVVWEPEHGDQQGAPGRKPDGLRAGGRWGGEDVADAIGNAGESCRAGDAIEGARGRDAGGGSVRQNSMALSSGQGLPERIGAAGERPHPAATGAGWWDAEPGMGRVVDGLANRAHRLWALGNGQVPLCAAVAWCLLGGPMSRALGEE